MSKPDVKLTKTNFIDLYGDGSIVEEKDYDPCENCIMEGEACLYCLDISATKNMLNLQDIEKVLLSYGMEQYETNSIMFKMKEKMRGSK